MSGAPFDPAGALGGVDPRRALQEVIRLAEEDRRRGIRYWFDEGLVSSLRDTVRDVSGDGTAPRGQAGGPRGETPAPRPAPRPVGPSSAAPRPASMPPGSPSPAPRPAPTSPGAAALPPRPAPTPPGASTPARQPAVPPAPAVPHPAAVPPVPADPVDGASGTAEVPARPAASLPAWGPPPEPVGRTADWEARLDALAAEASGCTACRLCETRHTVVFASGRARVPLVFVGEAPGHDEDLQGEAFVGRAGQLLTKIIEAIGLTREQVYICNVLKCRPPENRNPLPDEIAACRHYLEEQLEILQPKVICTLGLFAAQLLLGSTAPIGKLRGKLFTEGRWPILPTFHPAYLLRNPSAKPTVWADVKQLRTYLDS